MGLITKVGESDPPLFALRGTKNLQEPFFLRTFAAAFRESYHNVNNTPYPLTLNPEPLTLNPDPLTLTPEPLTLNP